MSQPPPWLDEDIAEPLPVTPPPPARSRERPAMSASAAPAAAPLPGPLLDLIARVDNVPLDFEHHHAPFYRLLLAPDPRPHGYMHPDTVAAMPWPAGFAVDHAERAVVLAAPPAGGALAAHANAAFQAAVDAAIARAVFPSLNGLHSEHFLVMGARAPVRIERFAAPLFGIATRGAHLTCYVPTPRGPEIWVARRSRSLFTYPGMLDSTVAGGVKAAHSPLECVLAEAAEEACLPPGLVAGAVRSAGAITLAHRSARTGLFHAEVLYAYDLALPPGVVPRPGDDEVEAFTLMTCRDVRARMHAGEFKPNVCAVMVDFLVRHGEVTPETEADYVEVCARLRRRLPVPTRPDV
ncbi:Uncharacterized protein TOPH_02642 [Tolypocladium ophioglossoides CBS 100239]|uniref:Nudix hydrolase domain-containing protein n=1 Tax=Tolypocladium ophioglossoides (strain CBS 100239) TaxID=1163406 RepID=A0A0L0NF90_TOLOC|nr:Uncharacterized protein TOPH_02642 [Tolypocladium ophioglossoides CBS 100239]